MIDPVELAKAKKILMQNIFDIAIEKKYKTNITEISLAVDFYFEWLKTIGARKFHLYMKTVDKRIRESYSDAIRGEGKTVGMNEVIALDALEIFLAEKNCIKYKLDIKGNLKFAKTIFEKKEPTKPTKKEPSKLGDGFEEDSEELPSIDDYFNSWI